MRRPWIPLIFALSIALVMAACNFPLFTNPSQEVSAIATSVARTVIALNAENQQKTTTPVSQLPSLPPLPTLTPLQLPTTVLLPTSTPLPCNKAQFISETIPDGTTFSSGENFTKTWRWTNIGTCTWNTNYKLVFSSGDSMSGPASKNLTASIAPNASVDLILNLKAPTTAGSSTGYWKLQGDDGQNFTQMTVQINVSNPTAFAVTSVNMAVDHSLIEADCATPQTFNVQATVTTSAAGTVTYYWTRSDGSSYGNSSLAFGAASSQTVSTSWQLSATDDYWIKLYVDNPNHQLFSPVDFHLTCTP